jgi:hypothetical protein
MQIVGLGMFSQTHKLEELTNMITEGTRICSSAYSFWFDKPVVVLVKVHQYCVPLPCNIVAETNAAVHVRIQRGWELKIRKELILAVEEVSANRENWMN